MLAGFDREIAGGEQVGLTQLSVAATISPTRSDGACPITPLNADRSTRCRRLGAYSSFLGCRGMLYAQLRFPGCPLFLSRAILLPAMLRYRNCASQSKARKHEMNYFLYLFTRW